MKKAIIALVALTSMSAFAADYRIGATSNAGFNMTSTGDAGVTVINVSAEATKLMGNLEFGLNVNFVNSSIDSDGALTSAQEDTANTLASGLGLSAVIGYNLDAANITNSIFFRAMVGFTDLMADDAEGEENLLKWTVMAGKNIKLSDSVAWAPYVSYGMTAAPEGLDDGTSVISVVPVSLAIYL